MKYALIIVAALVILRIDMFVGVVERFWDKIPRFQGSNSQTEKALSSTALGSSPGTPEIKLDQVSQLQLLFTEFSFNPDRSTREIIINFLKSHPSLLDLKPSILFTEMEKWIPEIRSENAEIPLLLNDLLDIFKNERAQVILQFYSLYFDDNPEFFIHYYPHLKDPNCIVMKYVWSNQNLISREQIISRKKQLDDLSGKIPIEKLAFAKNCQLVLRVEESKNTEDLNSP